MSILVRMHVLHLVAGSFGEGAARGAYWLHRALLSTGVDSRILGTSDVPTDDRTCRISGTAPNAPQRISARDRVERVLTRGGIQGFRVGLSGYDVRKHPWYPWADLIQLHWINGLVGLPDLRRIDKPLIWTLRDMWPMTGGCHYAMSCQRYSSGCGSCPMLGARHEKDLSFWLARAKRNALPAHTHIAPISRWLTRCAEQSYVLRDRPTHYIPNVVDTERFAPKDKQRARAELGLPLDRPIVLTGALRGTDPYKGVALFAEALQHLRSSPLIVTFGKNAEPSDTESAPWHAFGLVEDDAKLATIYSAADVFVSSSVQEAFGKTLVEAMLCETPVVAFDATGPSDIVSHLETGYLAESMDAESLASGIDWILNQDGASLGTAARMRALKYFAPSVVAGQYKALYRKVLANTPGI